MHADGLEVEHVFIGERAVFFGAEEGEDSQEFLLVDTGVLHGVEDVVFAVAVDVEGGVEALLVFQEIAFADEAGFPGVEEPEEVVFSATFMYSFSASVKASGMQIGVVRRMVSGSSVVSWRRMLA